jgi:RHS repeat-associated protein
LGRVTKETSPEGTATNTWDTASNGIGLLATATSTDDIKTSYTYTQGKPDFTAWTIDGISYDIEYNYELGRLAAVTYPAAPGATDRLKVAYGYNSFGYLRDVKDVASNSSFWTAVERNGAGQVTKERFGNGVQTQIKYDPANQLVTEIKTTGPESVGTLQEIAYLYDANLNVTDQKDKSSGRHSTYGYDELNRLKTWTAAGGQQQVTTAYSYDPVGNMKTERVSGLEGLDVTYTYGENGSPPHALSSRNREEYSYDAAGRQTSGPQRTVDYNRFDLPTVVTVGQARMTYRYDPAGNRTTSQGPNESSLVSVGGLFELRTDKSGEVHSQHNIVADGAVVAQLDWVKAGSGDSTVEKATTYFHTDRQGSTTRITDNQGQPTAATPNAAGLHYDPFGQRVDDDYRPWSPTSDDGPSQGYTGHEHDDETNLINMKGRIYDPQIRRFLTPDPYLQSTLASQTHNRYAYVLNNPATLTDPTGYSPDDDTSSSGETEQTQAGEVIYIQGEVTPSDEVNTMTLSDLGSTGASIMLSITARINSLMGMGNYSRVPARNYSPVDWFQQMLDDAPPVPDEPELRPLPRFGKKNGHAESIFFTGLKDFITYPLQQAV